MLWVTNLSCQVHDNLAAAGAGRSAGDLVLAVDAVGRIGQPELTYQLM